MRGKRKQGDEGKIEKRKTKKRRGNDGGVGMKAKNKERRQGDGKSRK